MLRKLIRIIFFIFSICSLAAAAHIDTLRIFSPSMHKNIGLLVVVPEQGSAEAKFPSVYLLHGYSGSYGDWQKHIDLRPLADKYGFILVCPDGGYNSWYLNSPIDSSSQYETHIIKEVIPSVDERYPTLGRGKTRAITGLSMGGQGALYLAARHRGLFFAAASMSGGVDLTYSTKRWEIAQKIGSFNKFPQRWQKNSVVNMIPQLKQAGLALLVDCGVKDIFIDVNRTLHQRLMKAGVAHDYCERPGGHSWRYWMNALEYHLFFFKKQAKFN